MTTNQRVAIWIQTLRRPARRRFLSSHSGEDETRKVTTNDDTSVLKPAIFLFIPFIIMIHMCLFSWFKVSNEGTKYWFVSRLLNFNYSEKLLCTTSPSSWRGKIPKIRVLIKYILMFFSAIFCSSPLCSFSVLNERWG